MSDSVMDKINSAVREHLPEHVSKELQKVLRDGEHDKARVKELEGDVKGQCDLIEQRSQKIADLEKQVNAAGDLAQREKDVTRREDVQELKEMTTNYHSQCQSTHDLKELVGLAFRNPKIIHRVTESTEKDLPADPNAGRYSPGRGVAETKTKATETTQE